MPALQELCQQYLTQFQQAQELARSTSAPWLGRDALLDHIRETSHRIFLLRVSNDDLLKQIVLGRKAEDLAPEEIPILQQFAADLVEYFLQVDSGIAYCVHKLLYEYAVLHEDDDLCVRELYEQAVALSNCNKHQPDLGINTVGQRVSDLFARGAAYIDRFEELTDPVTRSYIVRCLGNRRIGMEELIGPNDHRLGFDFGSHYAAYRKLFDEAMAVFESPYYRGLAPELPWDRFIYTLHFGVTRYVVSLRSHNDPDMRRDVLASAEYIYRWQERVAQDHTGRYIPIVARYRYALARFYNGLIDEDALMQELLAMRGSAPANDYGFEGQRANLWLPTMIAYHFSQCTPEVQARYAAEIEGWQQRTTEYLAHAPLNQQTHALDSMVALVLDFRMMMAPTTQDQVMELLLVRHPPTYVHSRMVAELCVWLFDRLLDTDPAALAGVFGIESEAALRANRAELVKEVYSCGLYHDVGKNMMLNVIGLYGRRLLDEEFALIQCHPLYSWYILRHHPHMENEAMTALYHHITCDGKHGYPYNIPPLPDDLRPMVDILVVADTLDAATDNIGRSYAQSKSLDTLLGELRAGSGTRYPPRVVALFDDAAFCAATGALLARRRADLYIEIYSAPARPEG